MRTYYRGLDAFMTDDQFVWSAGATPSGLRRPAVLRTGARGDDLRNA